MRFDHRQLLRRALYVTLLRERGMGSRWNRTSKSFNANFAGFCQDCGGPIARGELVAQGLTTSDGEVIRAVIHETCPTWEQRYELLFKIDGDLVLQTLEDPTDQSCYICRASLVTGAVQLANPNPYPVWNPEMGQMGAWMPWRRSAYVCARHVVQSGQSPSLEERRAEVHELDPPVTRRGM